MSDFDVLPWYLIYVGVILVGGFVWCLYDLIFDPHRRWWRR